MKPAVPRPARVPIEVEGRGGAGRVRGSEEPRQARLQGALQEERADVYVAGGLHEGGVHVGGVEGRDGASGCDDGPVAAPIHDDGQPRGYLRVHTHAAHIDTTAGQLVQHEPSCPVVPEQACERDTQPQASSGAGGDGGGAAYGEDAAAGQLLGLSVGKRQRGVMQDDVWVRVAHDQQVHGTIGAADGIAHRCGPDLRAPPFTAEPPATRRGGRRGARRPSPSSDSGRASRRRSDPASRPGGCARGRRRAQPAP